MGKKIQARGNDQIIDDKKRITILVSNLIKKKWQKYIDKRTDLSTISKFLRKAADLYMQMYPSIGSVDKSLDISHDLKEPLTAIKGFTQLIIENHKDKVEWEVLSNLKDIFDQCLVLERIIDDHFSIYKTELELDILIVDDDALTNKVLTNFFTLKGYSCKDAITGNEALKVMEKIKPKLILLDIILPHIDGYQLCKMIKEKYKDIPIYFITAVPLSEVSKKIKETGANGFFLKPFSFQEFEVLYEILLKS